MLCKAFGVLRKMNDVESPDIGPEATLVAFDIEEYHKGDQACPVDNDLSFQAFHVGTQGFVL
jgi:hypothetical protein